MKKFLAVAIVCVLLLCTMSSCGDIDRLEVTSLDYPGLKYLKKGELTKDMWNEWSSPDHPYGAFELKLSVDDGKLLVYDEETPKSHVAAFDN